MKIFKKPVFLGVVAVFLSYLLYLKFVPLSLDEARARAADEFSYICTDFRINGSVYTGPTEVESSTEGVRVFEWMAVEDGKKSTMYVRVPDYRIGDYTFGLLGRDVTSGNVGDLLGQ